MRLRHLQIDEYGLFSNRSLTFESAGLQLIYGPNGAGKTTLLALLRDLLFGIPVRTPYAFRGVKELAATATIELEDGRQLRFRRRKGRKDVVSGEFSHTGESVDEAALLQLLDGASEELYHNLFAFSQQELAAGTDSLQRARPGEVLFGMGIANLTTFRRMQESITGEREELFKSRGRNQVINQLIQRVRAKEIELQSAGISPQDYADRQATIDHLAREVERLQAESDQLEEQHLVLTRRLDALPLLRRRDELTVLLRDLDPQTKAITPDQLNEYERLSSLVEKRSADIEQLRQQTIAEQAPLSTQESHWLLRTSEVRELFGQSELVRQWQSELRECRNQYDAPGSSLLQQSPTLRFADQVPPPALPSSEEVDHSCGELARKFDELQRQLTAARQQHNADSERVAAITRRQAELKSHRLDDQAAALLSQAGSYRLQRDTEQSKSQRLAELMEESQQLQSQLQQQLPDQDLSIATGSLPHIEQIEKSTAGWRDAGRQLTQLQRELDDLDQQLVAAQVDATAAGAPASEADELVALRQRRDDGWQLIRRRYVENEDSPALASQIDQWTSSTPHELIDQYQQIVAEADRSADSARATASDLARAAERARQLQRLEQRRKDKRDELASAVKHENAARGQCDALWSGTGIAPGSPDVMLDWLGVFCAWSANQERLRLTQKAHDEIRHQLEAFETQLRECTDSANNQPAEELLQELEARHQLSLKCQAEHDVLCQERQTLARQIAARKAQLTEWEQDRNRALTHLRQVLSAWGIDVLPLQESNDQSADHCLQDSIDELCRLCDVDARRTALTDRINELDARLEDWSQRVMELASEAPLDDLPESACEAIILLHETTLALEQRQRQIDAHEQAHRETERLIEEWTRQRSEADSQRKSLCDQLGIYPDGDVPQQLTRLRKIVSAGAELTGIEARLGALCDAQSLATTTAESEQTLRDQRQSLQKLQQAVREQLQQATQQFGVANDRLASLAAEDRTSLLAAQRESLLAQLSGEVDRWASLVVAEQLLQRARKRFETNHQPQVLLRSSQLLRQMTGGDLTAVHRELGNRPGETSLVVETSRGARLAPAALSRGAHQQLYLALRLALVDEYCRQNEPLPVVMDDVLVDFDDHRARRTVEVLCEFSAQRQVLFLTCHERIVQMVREAQPDTQAMELVPGSLGQLRAWDASADVAAAEQGATTASTPRSSRRPKRPKQDSSRDGSQRILFPEAR